ncbi:cytochrome c oxidase assembly protein [soil metagenome]
MTRRLLLITGLVVLAAAWLGPLPSLAPHYFSAHMTMHMAVVAIAAPLIALGVAGTRMDLTHRYPALFSPIPASLVELLIVWGWHAPALHHAARTSTSGLFTEQAMFLLSGLLVWLAAFGSEARRSGSRAGAGVVALLLTSMHMTLLGALLGLAPRALYGHGAPGGPSPLDEQHLGGAIMLGVGGVSYLVGGLWLSVRLVAPGSPAVTARSGQGRGGEAA